MIVDKGSHSVNVMVLFVSSRNNSRELTMQIGTPQHKVSLVVVLNSMYKPRGQERLVESSVDHQRR